MGVLLLSSIVTAMTFAQASPQTISLTIEEINTYLNKEVLIAECRSRSIRVRETQAASAFKVAIRTKTQENLEVSITDLDGETSLRTLKLTTRSGPEVSPLEREIALIIESVIRRWERKRQAARPSAAAPKPAQGPPPPQPQPTAEPRREAAILGPERALPGVFSSLWSEPGFELAIAGTGGFSVDDRGPLLGGGIALRASYGDRLRLGAAGLLSFSKVEANTPLAIKSGDFSEWSAALYGSLTPLEDQSEWRISTQLGLGSQRLDASEGFTASGIFSVFTVGTAYHFSLTAFAGQTLDLTLGLYGDWTWIGPAFTWEPGIVAYGPARLRLRGELGVAWQF